MNLKELTHPNEINERLIRIGNKFGDGGYVVNTSALNTNICYSYGIGDNYTFDEDYTIKTGNLVHMYDHTVNINTKNPKLIFHKEGLSGNKTHDCNNYINHLIENKDTDKQILLKIDVECAEYNWILATDIKFLAKYTPTIVIEFHCIRDNKELFTYCMQKLLTYYTICHVHGNNFCGMVDGIPEIPEYTFVRNDNKNLGVKVKKLYPIFDIDYPNDNQKPDIIIDYR